MVPWDQSSLSVGFPRVWQRYSSMTGDQTIPSLVRHQPIYSLEKGLYLSTWHEDPKIETPLIGAKTWVAYFGDHCWLCTLMAVIICPWPYYLHCDIDPQCTVLVAMLLVVYFITWIRSVLVGGHAPHTSSMGMPASGRLIYKWHAYPDLWLQVPSDPLLNSSLLQLDSVFSSVYNITNYLFSVLWPSVPSDLAH